MPLYDLTCPNSHEQIDVMLKVGERPPCPTCGEATETLWRSSSGVIADDIPGGMVFQHGICWPDGTPRKFYSHTEIKRAMKENNVTNTVRHVGNKESDKNSHTSRWY